MTKACSASTPTPDTPDVPEGGSGGARRGPGRPTSYDPAFCEKVISLGEQGYSKAMIAAELHVARQTLDNWTQSHPAFSDAMARARELSLAWWEEQGLKGIWSKDFNANAYRLQMTNRFPDEWRDERRVQWSGSLAKWDMSKLPDPVVEAIAHGVHPMAALASYFEARGGQEAIDRLLGASAEPVQAEQGPDFELDAE